MRLYIIRHGETDWNKEQRLQGKSDIPLNEFGRYLARKTAEALQDVEIDHIITSPLKRARETAEIIKVGRHIEMQEDARIMEIGFGIYEGLCCKGENYNIPDCDFEWFQSKPESYKAPEGGESFQELRDRTNIFLEELLQQSAYKDKTILISTHGATLSGLLANIKKYPIEKIWAGGLHKNCAVTIIEAGEGEPKILQEAVTYYEEEAETW